jgi:hypothetical protein
VHDHLLVTDLPEKKDRRRRRLAERQRELIPRELGRERLAQRVLH